MKIRLLLIMAMLSCVDFLAPKTQGASLVLTKETFEEATLGGKMGPSLIPTDQTGITPANGTYQSIPNDDAEIVGGLGNSTRALKFYDHELNKNARAIFKRDPLIDPNTYSSGILEVSFDFKLEPSSKAFEDYTYPLLFRLTGFSASEDADSQYLTFLVNSGGIVFATNCSTNGLQSQIIMDGNKSLSLNTEYSALLTLNLDTGLYSVAISGVGTVDNLLFTQNVNNHHYGYMDFAGGANDFNSGNGVNNGSIIDNLLVTHIPEPTAVSLLILGGGAGILAVRKRRSS